jgi:hypothetical protein
MIAMEPKEEIPCAKCHSYKAKDKKFSCNPQDCKELSDWIFENVTQLRTESLQTQRCPEIAVRYVV